VPISGRHTAVSECLHSVSVQVQVTTACGSIATAQQQHHNTTCGDVVQVLMKAADAVMATQSTCLK
jgi:hypothetical protein